MFQDWKHFIINRSEMIIYLRTPVYTVDHRHQYLSEKKNTQLMHTTATWLMKNKEMSYNEYLIPKYRKFADCTFFKKEGLFRGNVLLFGLQALPFLLWS